MLGIGKADDEMIAGRVQEELADLLPSSSAAATGGYLDGCML